MPRPPRLHVPGGCYHVILRGNHREPLFGSDRDRHALNEIVADVVCRHQLRIHAFCWMTNHLHALVQVADQPLGPFMKRLAMRYSRYRHRALQTTGHLFERRYRAKLVDVDAYFLTLIRYVHLNPVWAGIVTDPFDFPWCSHRAYLGEQSISWLTTDFGLSLLSGDLQQARNLYRQLVSGADLGSGEEGIESLTHPEDPRILGTDSFMSKLQVSALQPRSLLSLEALAAGLCSSRGISVERLRSRSSARELTPIRLDLLHRALDQRVATLSEVARFLNRDPSNLTHLSRRHAKIQ